MFLHHLISRKIKVQLNYNCFLVYLQSFYWDILLNQQFKVTCKIEEAMQL